MISYKTTNIDTEIFYLKNTKNKGRAIFAKKNIEKGLLIQACPIILFKYPEELVLPTEIENIVFDYEENDLCFIALGIGSLFNHCDKNNINYKLNKKNNLLYFKANRNILKNEELTVDYGESWFSSRNMEKL